MYNQTYEDYIRSILGYPRQMDNTYSTNTGENVYMQSTSDVNSDEIEQFYPEIYKIVYPMVCKVCNNNTSPITKELIENMTNDIYFSIESDNEIGLNITLGNDVRASSSSDNSNNYVKPINRNLHNEENRPTISSNKKTSEQIAKIENRNVKETKSENRQIRNNSLRDLIQILIIRQLLKNRRNRPNRPNQLPLRPPFPGRPGGMEQGPGQGRPQFMPRSSFYNESNPMRFQDIYETF